MAKIETKSYLSESDIVARGQLLEFFKNCPIPEGERLSHLGLFIKRQDLSRMLFLHELYQRALDVPGIIIEFGVRWGQTLALFESFRGMYEPFNHTRKIVGFDSFEGFPSVHEKDGNSSIVKRGAYAVTENYADYLEGLLSCHEQHSPISHIKKFELVVGDATIEIGKYLQRNPETIVSLAYFDFDIYEPTKKCLDAIKPHLTRGSVIGFDELAVHDFPGETLALKESFGLDRYRLKRSQFTSVQSYLVVE